MKLSLASLALSAAFGGFAAGLGAMPAFAQEFRVIPTRVIYPGETIGPDVLKMAKIRKGRTSTVVIALKAEELVGKVAQRTLLANRFVPVTYVREAYVVEAGKPVFAELVEDSLTIT